MYCNAAVNCTDACQQFLPFLVEMKSGVATTLRDLRTDTQETLIFDTGDTFVAESVLLLRMLQCPACRHRSTAVYLTAAVSLSVSQAPRVSADVR